MTGVETFIGFWGGVFGAGTTAAYVAAAITAVVVNAAIAYAIGKLLAPSFNDSRDVRAMQDTVRDNILPRRVVYGQAVAGGPLLWYEANGSDNNRLTLVVALTGHPVEDILGVWIDEEYLRIDGLGEAPFSYDNYNSANNAFNTDWSISQRPYNKITSSGKPAGRVIKNTGWGFATIEYVTDQTKSHVVTDQARAEHMAGYIDANNTASTRWVLDSTVKNSRDSQTGIYTASGRKVTNCSYIMVQLWFDQEIWTATPKVKFHVKGKRVYNPYKDPNLVQYGADSAGTHDLYDPDTWEWSEDWTLCVLDYLLDPFFGIGARASTNPDEIDNVLYNEIDWAQAIESYLESSAAYTTGLSPSDRYYSATGPRYTLNGLFEVDATPISIMESLLTSGSGRIIYSQGKYRIRAGYYKAPESEADIINEDMIIGPMTIQTHTPRADLFNKVGGSYINAGYDLTKDPDNQNNRPEFVNDEFPIVDPNAPNNPYEIED
jgi:hypothetical protein